MATRRRPLTGLSEFPDPTESPPPPVDGGGAVADATPFPPLGLRRLAADFEEQRGRADRHEELTGERPQVFLATLGPPAAHTPRLTFARNLFHVAGIGTVDGPPESVPDGTALACLCASDDGYREAAAPAVATLRAAGVPRVFLAGRGLDIEDVDEEVGVGSDVLDLLTRTLDHLLADPEGVR